MQSPISFETYYFGQQAQGNNNTQYYENKFAKIQSHIDYLHREIDELKKIIAEYIITGDK